ncbi:hypothetical protein VTO42DRAFT_1123 [Malbranchea cinnamomea]
MTYNPEKTGRCPVPFMQEDLFPSTGGFIGGRYCQSLTEELTCCLPCPISDWKYPHQYRTISRVANWLAVVFFALNSLILISYVFLPPKITGRHYLNALMITGIMLMALSFIVSLGAQPQECYNEITPNDMKSDIACAFSGALILFGAWATIVWSFFRTLSLHLQICWDVVPGKAFSIGTVSIGWAICIAMLAVALILTGTSYRFGSICHINHDYGLQDFWGPLMGVSAASLLIHAATICYCIHIYLRSVMDDSPTTENSSMGYSANRSVRTMSARQAYRRVRRVLQLQWRGIATALAVLGNVIFFAIIFLQSDRAAVLTEENIAKNQDWIICLVTSRGDPRKCSNEAAKTGPSEAAVSAVLILLSMVGFWTTIFFGHLSMLRGWFDYFKQKFSSKHEFVSIDARARPNGGPPSRAYEMYSTDTMKSPEPLLASTSASPSDASSTFYHSDNYHYLQPSNPDHLNPFEYHPPREAKYTSPVLSFSTPRPPSATVRKQSMSREWDPRSTFARGGDGRDLYRTHHYTNSGLS